jgi:DNA-binding NarL/FixJ family response regulator
MTTERRITVVIVDDDQRVLRNFAELVDLESDLVVIAQAHDGETAVDVCQRLRPDVVVMDARMPRLDGIEATRRLRLDNPPWAKVLVVTTFDLDEYVLGAARAGAAGFLLKDQAPEELARAIRLVASGEAIVSPRATARLLQEFVRQPPEPASDTGLTERETDIVRLMAQGMSNDEIAREAFISVGTVKSHVSNILSKLQLQSRIQIVVWAFEHGLSNINRR